MGRSSRKNRKEVAAWVPVRHVGGVVGVRDAAGAVGGARRDAWGGAKIETAGDAWGGEEKGAGGHA